MKRNVFGLSLVLVLLLAVPALAQTDPELNDPEYWEQEGYGICDKLEPIADETFGWTLGNPPAGSWTLLVLKSATDNLLIPNPQPGVEYEVENERAISHVIRCWQTTTTTTADTTTTTNGTTSTTGGTTTTQASTTTSNPTTTTDPTTTTTEDDNDDPTTTTIPYDPTTTTNPTTTDPTTTSPTLPFTGFGEVAWWTALAVTLLLGGSLVVLSITRRE